MSYHVQRSIFIKASPEQVYDVVVDFNTWTKWSPWLCCDKAATVTVSDNPNSVGSLYHWTGDVVGEGEIEHLDLVPGKRVDDEIRFLKPFKSVAKVAFDLQGQAEGTKVTWHMIGNLPWFLFWMKSSIQRFIAMDYDRGLKMLAEYIEHGSVASDTTVGSVETIGPYTVVGVSDSTPMSSINESMDAAYERLDAAMKRANIPTNGEAISIYHRMNMKTSVMDYTAGYVVPSSTKISEPNLVSHQLPKTQALHVHHTGRYQHLGNAWSAAHANLRAKKLKISKACGGFELYRNSPSEVDAKDLVTDLYVPVR